MLRFENRKANQSKPYVRSDFKGFVPYGWKWRTESWYRISLSMGVIRVGRRCNGSDSIAQLIHKHHPACRRVRAESLHDKKLGCFFASIPEFLPKKFERGSPI
jgi:hypothetical protein